MTDEHDPLDAALRDALRAEPGDAAADDALLARIREARNPRRDRRPLLLAAAAIVAVAAVAAGLAITREDGGAQRVNAVDDPDDVASTTTTTTSPDQTSETTAVPGYSTTYDPTSGPSLIALVREDGWLVSVDLVTGEERELAFAGDPNDREEETGMTYFIDDVELSPDGRWVYFSTCCEPASGETFRIDLTDPERQYSDETLAFATGSSPRLSWDGNRLATLGADGMIFITDATGSGIEPVIYQPMDGRYFSDLSWGPGDQISAVSQTGPDGRERIVQYFRADRTRLTLIDPVIDDDRRRFPLWIGGDGMDPASPVDWVDDADIESARSLRQDATHFGPLLWVDNSGTLSASSIFDYHPGQPVPERRLVAGTPKALVADW